MFFICSGHRLRIWIHHHRRSIWIHHRHPMMGEIRHLRLKDGSLPVKGWMVFFESFVHAAHHGSGSFVVYSDSVPPVSSYLPVTRFCFVFVASCCFVADADKHCPDGRNIKMAFEIHSKGYSRWQAFLSPIHLSRACYYYYPFPVSHYLVRDSQVRLVCLNSVSDDYNSQFWSQYHLCDNNSGWIHRPCFSTHCWRSLHVCYYARRNYCRKNHRALDLHAIHPSKPDDKMKGPTIRIHHIRIRHIRIHIQNQNLC
jgi:hypothetical protein